MACPFCAVNRLIGRVIIAVADGIYVFGLWLMRPVDHRRG